MEEAEGRPVRSWDNRKGRTPVTVPFGQRHRGRPSVRFGHQSVVGRRRFLFFGARQFNGTHAQMTGEDNKWARPRREFGGRR
jgi:hypothetical protein